MDVLRVKKRTKNQNQNDLFQSMVAKKKEFTESD